MAVLFFGGRGRGKGNTPRDASSPSIMSSLSLCEIIVMCWKIFVSLEISTVSGLKILPTAGGNAESDEKLF